MSINQQETNCIPQSFVLSATKKKYSKVNESLKQRFLSLIIQHNMSIKDASQALNINYSSAKAILSSHRKSINVAKKNCKVGLQAVFRTLEQTEDSFSRFSVICSTGGRQTSRFGNIGKVKQIHKALINSVIILRMEKQGQSLQHTSHSVSN